MELTQKIKRNCSGSINDLVRKKKDGNFEIVSGPLGHLKEKRDGGKVGGCKGYERKDCLLSQSLSGIIGQQKA